jgi:Chemotaxis protein histidine kinase and related kinases
MEDAQEAAIVTKPLKIKKNGITISLVLKVTAIIAISIVLVSAMSNLIIFNLSYKALKDEIKDKILLLASIAVVSIDADELSSIKSYEDEGNEAYLRLQKKLQEIKKDSMGKIRYIYTLKKTRDKYIYVLDDSPIEDTKNHSSVGDVFDIHAYPVAAEGFIKPAVEKEPSSDKEFGGMTQSGYAPVKDKSGNVIGVLGVDIDVSVLLKDQAEMKQARIIALFCAFLLAILLGIIFSRYLTKPILVLTKGTKSVAEGDLGISVELKRKDELGQLACSFNSMIKDLDAADKSLKKYNLELEDKVAKRTSALSAINKEIRDILDNMSQAIFTIDEGLRFNPQYSKFAYHIFGNVSFADKNMLDVFFPNEEQKAMRDSMALWLGKIFKNDGASWNDLEALQPVKEVVINSDRAGEITKYIKINFKPITGALESEKVSKVMLIVQDITEKKSLQMEIVVKEKEYKDNINQIVEIIKMDQELFQDFITECKDNLVTFEPKLIQLKDDKENMELVNDLSRIMHTIKGNAKIFNLERIVGEAHGIENIFSSLRKGEITLTDNLLDETFKKLDKFNTIFTETMEIYYKIVRNMNTDFGKTRTDLRNKGESEVIKVKVNEINKLAELIKKAEMLIDNENALIITSIQDIEQESEIKGILKETGEKIKSIRKVSLKRLFARFPRMVRDVSIELGKKVKFISSGEDLFVDKFIYDNLSEPLIHIIRNSLDHGIEKPDERIRLGKTEEGIIRLDISKNDTGLMVAIHDNGKGMDKDKIKAKAVMKRLISPEEALLMSDEDSYNLIFLPGFSTNDFVTDISGRGLGMYVVKTSIEDNLNGSISIESKKNEGTVITLVIPDIAK